MWTADHKTFFLIDYKQLDLEYKKITNQHCVLFIYLDKVMDANYTVQIWLILFGCTEYDEITKGVLKQVPTNNLSVFGDAKST